MPLRRILIYPHPCLRRVAKPVETIDMNIQLLVSDMLETMYDAPGIGLAAPQIGESLQIVVMDCAESDEKGNPKILVNPKVIQKTDENDADTEGCLSFPGQTIEIVRPLEVDVRYTDIKGNDIKEHFSGLWARCVQHEIDHLNGKLFIDHISALRRQILIRKLKKELAETQQK